MKSKLRKGIAISIIFLLMLMIIPTTTGNDIEYPREKGPYIVFIGGKCYSGGIPGPINFEWLLLIEEGIQELYS